MTKTITNFNGNVTGNTTIWCSKTYRQCQGTALPGSGNCSSCGTYMGTGGVCLALVVAGTTVIELTAQQKKHAECPCCECDPNI